MGGPEDRTYGMYVLVLTECFRADTGLRDAGYFQGGLTQ